MKALRKPENLSRLRKMWTETDEAEDQRTPPSSLEESTRQFLDLHRTFYPFLEETESLFRPEREKHLIEFQERLQKLALWQKGRGK